MSTCPGFGVSTWVGLSVVVMLGVGCSLDSKQQTPTGVDAASIDREPQPRPTCETAPCDVQWASCLVDAEELASGCHAACGADCVAECGLEGRRAVASCKAALDECREQGGESRTQ